MCLQDPIRSFAWDANAYLTGSTYTLFVYSNGVNVCVLKYIAEIQPCRRISAGRIYTSDYWEEVFSYSTPAITRMQAQI